MDCRTIFQDCEMTSALSSDEPFDERPPWRLSAGVSDRHLMSSQFGGFIQN